MTVTITKKHHEILKKLRKIEPQCILTENLDVFMLPYRGGSSGAWSPPPYHLGTGNWIDKSGNTTPTDNYSYFQYDSQPDKMLSKFLASQGQDILEYIQMDPHLASTLVPQVSLYKITRELKIPFHFDAYLNNGQNFNGPDKIITELNNMSMLEPAADTRGVGIKSVSVNMNGDNVATSSRIFEVDIEYYFSSINEIFKKRGNDKYRYSYQELIAKKVRAPSKTDAEAKKICLEEQEPPSTRIYLEFGYATPKGSMWENRQKLVETITNMKHGLYLEIHNYKMNFAENGTVTLNVTYHGYVEKSPAKVDIFELGLTPDQRKKIKDLQLEVCRLKHKIGSTKKKDVAKKLRKRRKELLKDIGNIRDYGYPAILSRLILKDKVYDALMDFGPPGSGHEVSDWFDPDSVTLTAMGRARLKKNTSTQYWRRQGDWNQFDHNRKTSIEMDLSSIPKHYTLSFVHFGAIFDELLSLLREEAQYDEVSYILGHIYDTPLEIGDYHGLPLAGFPVEVGYFRKWFENTVIKRGGARTTYAAKDFINDMLRGLVGKSFSAQCVFDKDDKDVKLARPSPRFMSSIIEYDGILTPTPINSSEAVTATLYSWTSTGRNFSYKNINPTDNSNATQVQLMWASTNDFAGTVTEPLDASEDARRGRYHLVHGLGNGIVKGIKFKQTEIKYAREAHMTGGTTDIKSTLWAMYDCNVTLLGAPFFKPGMMVKILSTSFDQESADEIGLGGYFRVLKVSNKIEGGKFETELECKWEHRGS